MKRARRAVCVFVLVATSAATVLTQEPACAEDSIRTESSPVAVLDEVLELCRRYFYSNESSAPKWSSLRGKYQPLAEGARSEEELSLVINQMLSELKTSHTHFYTRSDPEYFQLLDIFKDGPLGHQIQSFWPNGKLDYAGIGIFTKKMHGSVFIKAILEGTPAHQSGLKVGDRIISVDGALYHPIKSFAGKEGKEVVMLVQEGKNPQDTNEIRVVPERMNPETLFFMAMKKSVRIIDRWNARIGYIHIWSYAGEQYQEALLNEIAFGRLKEADSLIIDLRNGWGGADPQYLNVFNRNVPTLTQIDHQGKKTVLDFQWRKPAVLLVNEGTRSGKEVLAYGFKKYGIGKVVGTTTAGAVMGGRPFLLKNGNVLYLAVADVLVDGERLEGKGVTPDVEVPFFLEYARGRDPQLERAVELLSKQLPKVF